MRFSPLSALFFVVSAYAVDVMNPKALLPLCRAMAPRQAVTLSAAFSTLPSDIHDTLHALGCDARVQNGHVTLHRIQIDIDADKWLGTLFAKLLAPRTEASEALGILQRIEDLLLAHTPSETIWKKIVEKWIPMARIKYREHGEVLKMLETLRKALRPDDLGWS